MKSSLHINNLFKVIGTAYAFSLSWGSAFFNCCLVLLVTVWIVQIFKKEIKITKEDIFLSILISGFFIFNAFTIFYSQNTSYGLKKISLQGSIVILAFVLITNKNLYDQFFLKTLIKAFTFGIISNLILSVVNQLIEGYYADGKWTDFILENNLSTSIVDNYFLGMSLLVSFAIIANLKLFALKSKKTEFYEKYNFFVVGILLIFLVLLNSRAVIFITITLGLMIVTKFFLNKRSFKNLALVFIIIIGTLGVNYKYNQHFSEKIKEAVNYNDTYNVKEYWGGRGMRLLIWDCAYKVVKESPILGVGIGDQQDELTLCYKIYMRDQLLFNNQSKFNAHNIFLQASISSGFIGLGIFLIGLITPLILTYKRSSLLIYFIILFGFSGLFESYLERNITVALFAFFNPVVFTLALSNKNENTSGS